MQGRLSPKAQLIIVAVLGVLVFYCGIKYQSFRLNKVTIETLDKQEIKQNTEQSTDLTSAQKENDVKELKMLTVHVVGAVATPGVYTFEDGKRVDDAVKAAVPLAKADLSLINLASPLSDGKQIYVPAKGEKPGRHTTIIGTNLEAGKINLNTASASQLDKLEGIGPALAGRIVDYRESKGSFNTIDEIVKVSGIGPALLEKIRDKITVD